jgi:hypothetical protein
MQVSKTARGNFSIFLSHNGLGACHGVLPVVKARFCHLMAGVSHHLVIAFSENSTMIGFLPVLLKCFLLDGIGGSGYSCQ